jgi:hypothetical protein
MRAAQWIVHVAENFHSRDSQSIRTFNPRNPPQFTAAKANGDPLPIKKSPAKDHRGAHSTIHGRASAGSQPNPLRAMFDRCTYQFASAVCGCK